MPNLKIEAKKNYDSVVQRNEHAKNILKVLDENKNFLLLGHTLPDADCISSLCAWALIIVKLKKKVSIYLPGNVPEQIAYLLDICRYNQISVFLDDIPENLKVEAIFILDTPKPEMIDASPRIWKLIESPDIIKAEIDHHLESDASSLTSEELRFVSSASSTCELIAYLIYKIGSKTDFVKKYETGVLFTRNVILSILTGIIGDTKNGVRFVSKRDKRMFNLFSKSLESKLDELTIKNSNNLANLEQVFDVIQSLSLNEKILIEELLENEIKRENISAVILDDDKSRELINKTDDYSLFVNTIKDVTDILAEHSGKTGLTMYLEEQEKRLYQIRIRCSKSYNKIDLRTILTNLKIENGGGHPGAIGLRIPPDAGLSQKEIFDMIAREIDLLVSKV